MTQQQVEHWPPGLRLRCIKGARERLTKGRDYIVHSCDKTHVDIGPEFACYYRSRFKPVVRVKMGARMLADNVPHDAMPGDLVVGNRGAAALVTEVFTASGLSSVLTLDYAGNYYHGASPRFGCKVYDNRGGT